MRSIASRAHDIDEVGAVGHMHGRGELAHHLRGCGNLANRFFLDPQADGQRTTIAAQGSGRFSVSPNGIGTADITISNGPMARLDYDFIIVDADDGLAEEVFAVLRTGGVNNQLVHPTWSRRSGAGKD